MDLPHVGRGQQAGEWFTGRDAHLAEGVVTDLGPVTLCASELIHSRQANSYKCPLNMKKKKNNITNIINLAGQPVMAIESAAL